jgi:rubrerythrin
MLTQARRCGVCGWRGEDEECPRCGTVLLRGRALCRRCGKTFDGPLARCDACGGDVEPPAPPDAGAAAERLARLPGMTPATARRLAARGFRDPADLLRLALPERAVRKGLHRAIARRMTLEDLPPGSRVRKAVECPVCGAPRDPRAARCPACDSPWEREADPNSIRKRFEEVTGEVYNLAADPDFQEMPPELQEEIFDAFEGAGLATSVESEYEEQFRVWRERGIETQELERILREEGSEAFKAKFVRLVRAQILKARRGGCFFCPLCDAEAAATIEECGNCGARFV